MITFQLNLLPKNYLKSRIDFPSFKFCVTGLCNSSTSFSFTLASDPVFLSKNLWTILANAL